MHRIEGIFKTDAECSGAITLLIKRILAADTPEDIARLEWKAMQKIGAYIDLYLAETYYGYEMEGQAETAPDANAVNS